MTHRPALAVELSGGYGVIEVETAQKFPPRLYGTMQMYEELTAGRDASSITTVLFVTGNGMIAEQVRRAAAKALLYEPQLKVRSLAEIVNQTRSGDFGPVQSEPAVIDADSDNDVAELEPVGGQQPDGDAAATQPNEAEPVDPERQADQAAVFEGQSGGPTRHVRWGRRSRKPPEEDAWFSAAAGGGENSDHTPR